MTARELISYKNSKPNPFWWCVAAFLLLLLIAEGLCGIVVTGFLLAVNTTVLYMGVAFLCLAATLFFCGERLNGYRIYGVLAGSAAYAVVLFLSETRLRAGAGQMANAVLQRINSKYESSLQLLSISENDGALTIFLLELFVIVVFLMAAVVVYRSDILKLLIVLFPFQIFLLLLGAEPSSLSLYLFFIGILGLFAVSGFVRKKQLWGKKGSERFQKNLGCYKNIQGKLVVIAIVIGVTLSVPSYFLMRPFLTLQFSGVENLADKAEGKVLGFFVDALPKISAGKWNVQMEASGSGVMNGVLGNAEGYKMEGVEDLKVTVSDKPEETIYLKGYVGSEYTGNSWSEPSGEGFDSASAKWKIQDNPRLYIQNLPFLRKTYIEEEADADTGMEQITVERLNANPEYTYYPYYSYLNDYYKVEAGDGSVRGQTEQEDIFFYFSGTDYRETVQAWNADEEKKSVLDKIERSYASYAAGYYLFVPDGFEELKKECESQKLKSEETEEVTEYIKTFFSNGYKYSMDVKALPEGEDFIHYFLYESKTGYSIHYASAAALMYRMFGIPSRYVVGYAAPRNLFTPLPEGNYSAVLCDDNAQAWTEIYIKGEGWTPVDMTPGAVGLAEEIEYQGDEVKEDAAGNNLKQEAETEDKNKGDKADKDTDGRFTKVWKNGSLQAVIMIVSGFILFTVISGGSLFAIKQRRKNLGLDRNKTPEERIINIFRAYYRELVRKGMSKDVESTSVEFANEVRKRNPSLSQAEFEQMMKLVFESSYGCSPKTEEDVSFMRELYQKQKQVIH